MTQVADTNFATSFELTITNEETSGGKRQKEYYDNGYSFATSLPKQEREVVCWREDILEPLSKHALIKDLAPGVYYVFATGWLDWEGKPNVETGWDEGAFKVTFARVEVERYGTVKKRKG